MAFLSLLLPTIAWSATLVQRIGELSSKTADAVISEVTVVPFSPGIDSRTPIILAPGKAYIKQRQGRPDRVRGLERAERRAIRRAYKAGQTILVLDAATHDVEALHLLLRDGAAHSSTTDPAVLAYALRKEDGVATARVVLGIRSSASNQEDPEAVNLAWRRAIDILVRELRFQPQPFTPGAVSSSTDWGDSPVQSTVLTSTSNGIYNTPVDTSGSKVEDCTSTIQMVGQKGLCARLDVGKPQTGQTPDGRLSDVAQTVNWRVDPATYVGSTFDITVTWKAQLATSTSHLWYGLFEKLPREPDSNTGPTGYCNLFGCSCGIRSVNDAIISVDHTFKVPFPSARCQ